MNLLPKHGRIKCNKCFSNKKTKWGITTLEKNNWKLENNPIACGNNNPLILILGFSKGINQTKNILNMPINHIPFKGMRSNLTKILQKLDLLQLNENIDKRINKKEKIFAFGSILRCSISNRKNNSGQYIKTGNIINLSYKNAVPTKYINNCIKQFLKKIPPKLRIIIMLGNNDAYINNNFNLFKKYHHDIEIINDIAYGNKRITWVHVVHPSGVNIKNIIDWLNSTEGKQAKKRIFAKEVIKKIKIN